MAAGFHGAATVLAADIFIPAKRCAAFGADRPFHAGEGLL